MKLSEIQTTLRELGASPTKSLGQNFLHDRNLAEWTVAQLEIGPNDRWLEIGPGLGALTQFALKRSPHGILVEKDDRLIAFLNDRFPQLRVIHGDASKFDVRQLMPGGPLKVFGNLPYYVSSQILFNFTSEITPATRQVFTLQKELAERLAASPGSKDFGAPSVLIGRRWKVEIIRNLPPSVFTPIPKVESSIVSLEMRHPEDFSICEESRFKALVKKGFSQRRKQLGNLLDDMIPNWESAAEKLGIPSTARAESLSIEHWCQLAAWEDQHEGYSLSDAPRAQDVHGEVFDVVDENDVVTGQASRFDVHQQNLKHRAVHVFVFNAAGDLFLQRRSRWKDKHPMVWDSSAAGHVNAGETYEETAPREIQEELGIRADPVFCSKIDACPETGEEFVHLYTSQHEGPFRLPPAEIDCGGWFPTSLIGEWVAHRPEDFAPGFLKCWRSWREQDCPHG